MPIPTSQREFERGSRCLVDAAEALTDLTQGGGILPLSLEALPETAKRLPANVWRGGDLGTAETRPKPLRNGRESTENGRGAYRAFGSRRATPSQWRTSRGTGVERPHSSGIPALRSPAK